jgi:hypothetical protein
LLVVVALLVDVGVAATAAVPVSDAAGSFNVGAGCSGSAPLPGAGCSIQATCAPSL